MWMRMMMAAVLGLAGCAASAGEPQVRRRMGSPIRAFHTRAGRWWRSTSTTRCPSNPT